MIKCYWGTKLSFKGREGLCNEVINGLKRDKDVIGCSSLPAAGAANAAPPLQRRVIVAKKCRKVSATREREGERKKETSITAASQQQRTFPCLGKMITANCLSRAFRSRETFAIEAKLSKPLNEFRNLLLFAIFSCLFNPSPLTSPAFNLGGTFESFLAELVPAVCTHQESLPGPRWHQWWLPYKRIGAT